MFKVRGPKAIGPSGQKKPLLLMPARLAAVVGACQGWVRWLRWRGLLYFNLRLTFAQLCFMFIRVFVGLE